MFWEFALSLFLTFPALAQVQTPARIENTENPAARRLSWDSSADRSYFLQQSPDLATWTYLPEVLKGRGGQDALNITSAAPKEFYRLIWSDHVVDDPLTADHDGDGVPSYAELTVTNTDPLKASTDGKKNDRTRFPSPSNGVHVDPATGVQYVIVPNPPGTSGSSKILASRYFDTPDYGIEYKAGTLNLEKKGFQEFTGSTSKRYLTWNRYFRPTDRNGNWISGNWRFGETQSIGLYVLADYNTREIHSINPVTGGETIGGAGFGNTHYGTTNIAIAMSKPGGFDKEEPDSRRRWVGSKRNAQKPTAHGSSPWSKEWPEARKSHWRISRPPSGNTTTARKCLKANGAHPFRSETCNPSAPHLSS